MSDTEKKEVITLKAYLEQNKDLLSILGVFVAIAVFSGSLSIKLIAAFISFAAFTCATLILIEFWRQPLQGTASFGLYFFRIVLLILAFGFFAYWFVVVDAIYPDAVFPVLVLLILEIFALSLEKLKEKFVRIERILGTFKKRKVLVIIVFIIIMVVVLVLSRVIANVVNISIFKTVLKIIEISSKIQGPIQ